MTREKLMSMSDWLWKILMPVFLAVVSFVLQNAATELRELRAEIKQMRFEYQAKLESLSISIAALQTRLDYHEKARQ